MKTIEAIQDILVDALADAQRVYMTDRAAGAASADFDAGRYDGLKQALEIIDQTAPTGR